MGDSKNILVGAASLYVGPSWDGTGTDPAPAPVTTAAYRTTIAAATGWTDVGYTQDGVEVATDPSWTDVPVDQLLDAAKIFQDGMSLSVTTTLAEATLENLLIAWGEPDDSLAAETGDNVLDISGGTLGAAPLERGLVAIGNAPGATANTYAERIYRLHRVLSTEGVSHTMARADATVIPVTFRALPDNNGLYGTVRDKAPVA